MADDVIVRTITITDEGVSLEYVRPAEDIKANNVQLNHVMFVPLGDDYDDEIDNIVTAAAYLVNDVLEDMPQLKSMADAIRQSTRRTPDDEEDD